MSTNKPSIGLPKMHLEVGEKRVFLPRFVAELNQMGFNVILEDDYGAGIGLSNDDYLSLAGEVKFASQEQVYQQDFILVLRYPGEERVNLINPFSCLISMLHYPTRPGRVRQLVDNQLRAISLDTIKDDSNRRLVENLSAVAWNGMRISIEELRKVYPQPGFNSLRRPPIRVTLLGAGAVGKQVIQAAVAYGDVQLRQQMFQRGVPGVTVQVLDYDLTKHAGIIQEVFAKTDILVDATQRPDPSQSVIPNSWLTWLPQHAIITDLSVDPYTLDSDPPVVRGIEGIPQGSLDKYVFTADDPQWDLTVPASVPSDVRRTAITCYSWPGIFPEDCMKHYGQQLRPLMKRLVRKGYDGLSLQGDFFERALFRGTLKFWLQVQQAGI